MAILGFKKLFVKPIRKRIKGQTIRAFRKYPIRPFEHLYLWSGLRNRYVKAEKIGEAQCTGTKMITIRKNSVTLHDMIKIRLTDEKELNRFAKADGFTSWGHMKDFWYNEHGPKCFPFTGTIIYFNLLRKKDWRLVKPSRGQVRKLKQLFE